MKAYLKDEQDKGKGYQHFFQSAPPDPNFPSNYNFLLVSTEDQFGEMCEKALSQPRLILGADTETTGFNHLTEEVVGASLCFEESTAYYLPLGHRVGTNLPGTVVPYLIQLLYRAESCILYNARFDLRFFRKLGADISKILFYDASVPLWLTDSNIRMPGLKDGSKRFLGWDMTTYEEALGEQPDLSFTSPEEACFYAGADALSTWHLARRLEFIRKRHPTVVDIDNKVLRPVMLMEETPTPIDLPSIMETREQVNARMNELEKMIYTSLGTVFKINAGNQLAQALIENGVDTGVRTEKKKQMKTGADELAKVEDQHESIPWILEFKKLHKFLTTYVNVLMEEYNPEVGGLRFGYQTTVTPTGRLAAGTEKKNSFFAKMNVQAIDKADEMRYRAVPCEDISDPKNFKGWRFVSEEESPEHEGPWVEGFSQERNVRKAFKAYPNHLWVHFDYKTQELRIPANLSGEPVWVDAFVNEEDLHYKVAALIWGEDVAHKWRTHAKKINFGALFGGTKYTFAKSIGCTTEQAAEYLDTWWSVLGTLSRWVTRSERLAKKQGYIETHFGRPRRVKWYFAQKKFSWINFAKRTAINTQVQGAGADIVKLAMIKIYDEILTNPNNHGRIQLLSQVHDELNFSILNEEPFFTAACLKIQELMQFKIPGWKVPMLVDCAIGDSWGNMFPMHFDLEKDLWLPTYA